MTDLPIEALHQSAQIYTSGRRLEDASAAMILIHGRGASARDILKLANELHHPDFTYLAPQAVNSSWYPYRFLAPIEQNEPWLSSGLKVIEELIAQAAAAGIPADKVILAGFSQGACLAAEFTARHARRFGGLLVFTGGLIGPPGTQFNYEGTLDGTPVFIGCGDHDPHIPEARVHETAVALRELGAQVEMKIYPGLPHTINEDEIDEARRIVENVTEVRP